METTYINLKTAKSPIFELYPPLDLNKSHTIGFVISQNGWEHNAFDKVVINPNTTKRISKVMCESLSNIIKCMSDNLLAYLQTINYHQDFSRFKLIIGPNWWEIFSDNVMGNLVGSFRIIRGNYPYTFLSVKGFDRYDNFKPADISKYKSNVSLHYISEQEYLNIINFIDNFTHRLVELFAVVYDEAKPYSDK